MDFLKCKDPTGNCGDWVEMVSRIIANSDRTISSRKQKIAHGVDLGPEFTVSSLLTFWRFLIKKNLQIVSIRNNIIYFEFCPICKEKGFRFLRNGNNVTQHVQSKVAKANGCSKDGKLFFSKQNNQMYAMRHPRGQPLLSETRTRCVWNGCEKTSFLRG